MPSPIEFYFDFSSPYAYLASECIDAMAERHGRVVVWKPILLGIVFRATGSRPLVDQPLKGDYAKIDVFRTARFLDVPFHWPTPFPVATQAAARAYYWLEQQDPVAARCLAQGLFRAFFVHSRNIGDPEVVLAVAGEQGHAATAAAAALEDPALKERLRQETDTAVARGVYGAPFIFVDGEPFFGTDRFAQIERWLQQGGF
ncbi:MAG: 2-hydroxychromene-2-carboxylate isomerase [Proteobacteria bacterium]|nr:2-hydroxychromene-2-carboxylate isomerase [Pseudomonadota bacterium]HQR04126.1 2-hydroxychromene-2-carboxylate isomerase [Rhodocyclaceae bacterium]